MKQVHRNPQVLCELAKVHVRAIGHPRECTPFAWRWGAWKKVSQKLLGPKWVVNNGDFTHGIEIRKKFNNSTKIQAYDSDMCRFFFWRHWHQNEKTISGKISQYPRKKIETSNTVDGKNPAPVEAGSLSHYLQGFVHPRWCRISSINSMLAKLKKL